MKVPLQFRAIKNGEKGSGPLSIQGSRDGVNWESGVSGLDAADVTKQFTRLHSHGAVIVDTPDYTLPKGAA